MDSNWIRSALWAGDVDVVLRVQVGLRFLQPKHPCRKLVSAVMDRFKPANKQRSKSKLLRNRCHDTRLPKSDSQQPGILLQHFLYRMLVGNLCELHKDGVKKKQGWGDHQEALQACQ